MTDYVSVELTLNGDACTELSLAFVHPGDDVLADPIWISRGHIRNLDRVLDGVGEIKWGVREKVEIHIPAWVAEADGIDPYAEEIMVEEAYDNETG